MSEARTHDVVLLGVTGFTGRQVARYFAAHAPRDRVRWALAARSPDRLRAVRDGLGPDFAQVPLLTVDTGDAGAVAEMAASARVVLTTVGPYARYGDAVVDACVAAGTDYVDITGETHWVRGLIERHHDRAAAEGTRIVPFCGFDSVPSDLGAFLLARHLREERGQATRAVRAAVRMKGGFNGGTLASVLALGEAGGQARLADPFLLQPGFTPPADLVARSRDPRRAWHDPDLDAWLAPFLMAPVNTRVVRRSAALLAARGEGYGPDFVYGEGMRMKGRLGASLAAGVLGGATGLVETGWGRALAARLGPAPGEGPSEAAMDGGFFRMDLVAEGADGARVYGRVEGQGDPGNRCTVRMLCESALALVLDRPDLPPGGGLLTPASALGAVLLRRLRAAGMVFAVTEG